MIIATLIGIIIGTLIAAGILYLFASLVNIEYATYGRCIVCVILSGIINVFIGICIGVLLMIILSPFGIEKPPETALMITGSLVEFVVLAFCAMAVFQTKLNKAITLAVVMFIFGLLMDAWFSPGEEPELSSQPDQIKYQVLIEQ